MFSPLACCGFEALPPSTFDAPAAYVFVFAQLQSAIAWTLALALIAAALGVLQQAERRRFLALRGFVRRHLQAVWCAEVTPRISTPLRRGVGGTPSRVPPRPAAGSTLSLRLASHRGRRR
jgi:hypothetical protein